MRHALVLIAGIGCALGPCGHALAGAADMFVIGLEEVVSDGVPGPGAGNIETDGATDVYELTVAADTEVYFDELAGSCGIRWACEDPTGGLVFSGDAMCVTDPGSFTLDMTGTYTITVSANPGVTGAYSFTVWEVNPDDVFAIGIKQTVSDGVPGPGAGNIEEPGAEDVYTFTADPGQVVFFDELGGGCGIRWICVDSTDAVIFSDTAICVTDPGVNVLELGGTYTITVFGAGGATGSYSFLIWDVNPTDEFEIGLEEIVSDGVPGPGAGNIEEAGTLDVYTFTVAPGTDIYFDELEGPCGLRWRCEDAAQTEIFNDTAMCVTDPGTRTLALGGEYTITVFGLGDATGTYSFTLWTVEPPDVFAIGLDEVVSDGFPGAGAGVLEEPGAIDVYTLDIAKPAEVCFEELSGPCNIEWSCEDPSSDELFGNDAVCVTNPGRFGLGGPGTYTITVISSTGATGAYSFIVNSAVPADFVGDCGVDVSDLLFLLGAWGSPAGDLSGDGNTDVLDLLVLLGAWG